MAKGDILFVLLPNPALICILQIQQSEPGFLLSFCWIRRERLIESPSYRIEHKRQNLPPGTYDGALHIRRCHHIDSRRPADSHMGDYSRLIRLRLGTGIESRTGGFIHKVQEHRTTGSAPFRFTEILSLAAGYEISG